MEGGEQPFPAEDAHNAEHRDESQGNPCAAKEAAADGSRGALAQGDAAKERQQEERGNGYGGDEQYPLHVVHVVHFCFGEGEGVVGAGGDAGEVFSRREVVDVVHAVGAQAHPLNEVVAVAVFGESGAVVFEPEEGRGGYGTNRNHEYGQRYGERDERCAELEEARGVFHGVFAGCGAFCRFGRGCQGGQRRVGVCNRVGVSGAGGFGAVLASGGGGACRLRGSDGFCFGRLFSFCCCSGFCFGGLLHGFAVEVAERRVFGGALRVADEGHEAGGDVGAGAYAGADALFA